MFRGLGQSRSEAEAAEAATAAAEAAATRTASLADARARQLAQLAKAAEESTNSAQVHHPTLVVFDPPIGYTVSQLTAGLSFCAIPHACTGGGSYQRW